MAEPESGPHTRELVKDEPLYHPPVWYDLPTRGRRKGESRPCAHCGVLAPMQVSQKDSAAMLKAEHDRWGPVLKAANIQPQ